jgi:hypothetical protein
MAQINVDGVIDALSQQTRLAPQDALHEVAPNARIDVNALFDAFHRGIRRCSRWEHVPDGAVEPSQN